MPRGTGKHSAAVQQVGRSVKSVESCSSWLTLHYVHTGHQRLCSGSLKQTGLTKRFFASSSSALTSKCEMCCVLKNNLVNLETLLAIGKCIVSIKIFLCHCLDTWLGIFQPNVSSPNFNIYSYVVWQNNLNYTGSLLEDGVCSTPRLKAPESHWKSYEKNVKISLSNYCFQGQKWLKLICDKLVTDPIFRRLLIFKNL